MDFVGLALVDVAYAPLGHFAVGIGPLGECLADEPGAVAAAVFEIWETLDLIELVNVQVLKHGEIARTLRSAQRFGEVTSPFSGVAFGVVFCEGVRQGIDIGEKGVAAEPFGTIVNPQVVVFEVCGKYLAVGRQDVAAFGGYD